MTQEECAAAFFIDGADVILSASEGSAFVFFVRRLLHERNLRRIDLAQL
jgi:hypothetical protein